MSKSNTKNSKIVSVITYILCLLLVVVALAGIAKCVKNKDTFCIDYGDLTYTVDGENKIKLPVEGQAVFKVKNADGYTVDVKPNVTKQNDIVYTVEGETYYLSDEKDLNIIFFDSGDINAEYFTIDCSKNLSLNGVLSSLWNGAEVTFENTVEYPFKLVVTAANGESIEIELSQSLFSIHLTLDHIIF